MLCFLHLLALSASLAFASPTQVHLTNKPKPGTEQPTLPAPVEFYDPRLNNGSMLNYAGPKGGEPLNVIISGLSSPAVLTDPGIINFARAIGFSAECLGLHMGDPQSANLGDGLGYNNQTLVLREDYHSVILGSCWESVVGGNHFRVFRQNGPEANSGALFLAVSQEFSVLRRHKIMPNGYDIGRDKLVELAVGQSYFGGITYNTTARNLTGLLPAGHLGVNHNISTDGNVVLLTIDIISENRSPFWDFRIPNLAHVSLSYVTILGSNIWLFSSLLSLVYL